MEEWTGLDHFYMKPLRKFPSMFEGTSPGRLTSEWPSHLFMEKHLQRRNPILSAIPPTRTSRSHTLSLSLKSTFHKIFKHRASLSPLFSGEFPTQAALFAIYIYFRGSDECMRILNKFNLLQTRNK